MNADPAAVVFDAMAKIKAGYSGVVIVDTAGRLHTRVNLMEELKKVKKIINKEMPENVTGNIVNRWMRQQARMPLPRRKLLKKKSEQPALF